jgi:hypothetical protein
VLSRSWFPGRWKCLACRGHQRLLFQHIHKFLLRKDVRPRKRSLFHCPPLPRVTRVYRYHQQCRGQIWFLQITAWVLNIPDPENRRFWIYQHLGRSARFQRRTGGYLTNSNFFCGPWLAKYYWGNFVWKRKRKCWTF